MRNTNFFKIMSIVAVAVMLNIAMLATALAEDKNTLFSMVNSMV